MRVIQDSNLVLADRADVLRLSKQGVPGVAFDPNLVAGLARWYKARGLNLQDGDHISTCTDFSSNASHATAAGDARQIGRAHV